MCSCRRVNEFQPLRNECDTGVDVGFMCYCEVWCLPTIPASFDCCMCPRDAEFPLLLAVYHQDGGGKKTPPTPFCSQRQK